MSNLIRVRVPGRDEQLVWNELAAFLVDRCLGDVDGDADMRSHVVKKMRAIYLRCSPGREFKFRLPSFPGRSGKDKELMAEALTAAVSDVSNHFHDSINALFLEICRLEVQIHQARTSSAAPADPEVRKP